MRFVGVSATQVYSHLYLDDEEEEAIQVYSPVSDYLYLDGDDNDDDDDDDEAIQVYSPVSDYLDDDEEEAIQVYSPASHLPLPGW